MSCFKCQSLSSQLMYVWALTWGEYCEKNYTPFKKRNLRYTILATLLEVISTLFFQNKSRQGKKGNNTIYQAQVFALLFWSALYLHKKFFIVLLLTLAADLVLLCCFFEKKNAPFPFSFPLLKLCCVVSVGMISGGVTNDLSFFPDQSHQTGCRLFWKLFRGTQPHQSCILFQAFPPPQKEISVVEGDCWFHVAWLASKHHNSMKMHSGLISVVLAFCFPQTEKNLFPNVQE